MLRSSDIAAKACHYNILGESRNISYATDLLEFDRNGLFVIFFERTIPVARDTLPQCEFSHIHPVLTLKTYSERSVDLQPASRPVFYY